MQEWMVGEHLQVTCWWVLQSMGAPNASMAGLPKGPSEGNPGQAAIGKVSFLIIACALQLALHQSLC